MAKDQKAGKPKGRQEDRSETPDCPGHKDVVEDPPEYSPSRQPSGGKGGNAQDRS
jgi:hypothetical protein